MERAILFFFFCVYRFVPDPDLETQGDGYNPPILEALSAVCVRAPHYGTRSVFFTHPGVRVGTQKKPLLNQSSMAGK